VISCGLVKVTYFVHTLSWYLCNLGLNHIANWRNHLLEGRWGIGDSLVGEELRWEQL
jgi:hypothetical protein